jgi:putative salt-induced outer membrane protein YdiY
VDFIEVPYYPKTTCINKLSMSTKAYTLGSLILCAAAAGAYGQSADAGAPTQPPKIWDVSAAIGLTLTSGNSDTLNVNGNVQATRKWGGKNELNLGADVAYGESDGEKNVDSYGGYAQYNRLFTERIFAYARVQGLHDGIADLDYRITLSPGVGYYFIKNEKTSLRGEVGPGYVFESQAGEENDYMTIRFAERWDQKVNDHVKLWQGVEYLPDVEDWSRYVVNFEIGVEIQITKHLSERTYFQDIYNSDPAPDRDNNDLKLVAALAYKF